MLPELYRAAGDKLCCHIIILFDWDRQNRTQCVFVMMLGEQDPGLDELHHSSVCSEADPNPTAAHATKHRPTSDWSARAS